MKKRHLHHTDDTTFMSRAGSGAKKHLATIIITTVMGTITGTVVPMIEQWHSDREIAGDIAAAEQRQQKAVDDLKQWNINLSKEQRAIEKALALHGIVVDIQ